MATKQYKVTLTDEAAEFLRSRDSRGRLSEGIDRLISSVRDAQALAPTPHRGHHTPTAQTDQDAPNIPRPHPATIAAEARKAEADAKRKATLYANHRSSMFDMLATGQHPEWQQANMESYIEYGIPLEYSQQVVAELKRDEDGSLAAARNEWEQAVAARERLGQAQKAQYKELIDSGVPPAQARAEVLGGQALPVQKLQLSIAALKGLGLFGTPADMPDDVIAAENEHFSKTPEEQAHVFDGVGEVL